MGDTGEHIPDSVSIDANTIAMRELVRHLEALEAEYIGLITQVHGAHHLHSRHPWDKCNMSTCQRAQLYLGVNDVTHSVSRESSNGSYRMA